MERHRILSVPALPESKHILAQPLGGPQAEEKSLYTYIPPRIVLFTFFMLNCVRSPGRIGLRATASRVKARRRCSSGSHRIDDVVHADADRQCSRFPRIARIVHPLPCVAHIGV